MQKRGQTTAPPSLTIPQPSRDFAERNGELRPAASGAVWPGQPGKAVLGPIFNIPLARPYTELASSQPNPDRVYALSIVQLCYPGPQLVGALFSSSISPPLPVMSGATETTSRADFSFPGSQFPTSLNLLLAFHVHSTEGNETRLPAPARIWARSKIKLCAKHKNAFPGRDAPFLSE